MKTICLALLVCLPTVALAHPGSGIVVTDGNVFFQDSVGRAIWQINRDGKPTKFYDKLGGHWIALDEQGAFSRAEPKIAERITPAGSTPCLLVADGGAPIAVCSDGNLYYGLSSEGNKLVAGVTRISPDGKRTVMSSKLNEEIDKLHGLTGLASGPDDTLYIACPSAIIKVKMDGTFTTIVHPIDVKDGDEYLPENNPSPYLRGIAADSHGTVYGAATGQRCVIKVTPDGKVGTVLKSERPWSPTGVAVHNGNVYVLEYTNANGAQTEGWTPRVRRLGSDGKITTLVTIDHANP